MGACSRLIPVIHASTPVSARSSASTLASLQHRSTVHGCPGLEASNTSISIPKRSSNCFQVASVSGNRTPVSIMNTWARGWIEVSMCTSTDSSFWKEQAMVSRGWKRSTA